MKTQRTEASDLFDSLYLVESSSRELQSEIQKNDTKTKKKPLITIASIPPIQFRDILDEYIKKCPKLFNINEIEEKYKSLSIDNFQGGPYCVFAIHECTRINLLLSLISSHLDELSQALSGYSNMTMKLEEIMRSVGKYSRTFVFRYYYHRHFLFRCILNIV